MATRHEDWMNQAKRDLQHAKNSFESQDYEWCCFAAQQSAEKAVRHFSRSQGRMRGDIR